MVQGDHGRHIALDQPAQHLAVAVQGIFVPAVRRGLDAAPLDREAVSVLTAFRSPVEIFPPAPAPPIAGQAGFIAVEDAPGCCSQAHQLLLVLLPSTWCEAVAVPHKKPRVERKVACAIITFL